MVVHQFEINPTKSAIFMGSLVTLAAIAGVIRLFAMSTFANRLVDRVNLPMRLNLVKELTLCEPTIREPIPARSRP